MQTSCRVISLSSLFLFTVLLATCAPDVASPDAVPPQPPVLELALRATPTLQMPEMPAATAPPVAVTTPDDVPTIAQEITRAIQANDVAQLAPLLLDAVWLAPDEDAGIGDSLSQADSLQWLRGHRGRKESVASIDYVRDSALLRITTTGWASLAPLQMGVVLFQLHRYDSSGQENDVQGNWRIDTILYQ